MPASTDAFVWLRLYQVEMDGLIPQGPDPAVVVDAANAGAAVDLSRGASHVRAAVAAGRRHRDAARAAAHRRLPDGRGPGDAADRRAVRPRSRPADHDADLPDAPQGGRDRRVLAHHAEQTRQAAARPLAPAAAPGYRPETLAVLFGNRRPDDRPSARRPEPAAVPARQPAGRARARRATRFPARAGPGDLAGHRADREQCWSSG